MQLNYIGLSLLLKHLVRLKEVTHSLAVFRALIGWLLGAGQDCCRHVT